MPFPAPVHDLLKNSGEAIKATIEKVAELKDKAAGGAKHPEERRDNDYAKKEPEKKYIANDDPRLPKN